MAYLNAEAFYSDQPPPRIGGSECENDLQAPAVPPVGWGYDARLSQAYVHSQTLNDAGYKAINTEYIHNEFGAWLANGAHLYIDMGHLEYCTPEVSGPRRMAAADAAGITVMTRIVASAGHEHGGLYRRTGSMHNRFVTNGYHQNFLVPTKSLPETICGETDGRNMALLASDLATRAWSWTGSVGQDGFEWSQKHRGIGQSLSVSMEDRVTEGKKPMIMLRGLFNHDRDVNPMREWSRVEIRCADAPFSRTSLFLGFAATSLALRVGEHADKLGGIPDKLLLSNANASLHKLAVSPQLDALLELRNGTTIHADDLQLEHLAVQQQLADLIELPADEQAAMTLLTAAAKAQGHFRRTGELEPLDLYCDAARKLMRLRGRMAPEHVNATNKSAVAMDLNYHRIDNHGPRQLPGTGLALALHKQRYTDVDETHVPQQLVDHFDQQADPLTRSVRRAQFVQEFNRQRPVHMDWSSGGGNEIKRFEQWPDPFQGLAA